MLLEGADVLVECKNAQAEMLTRRPFFLSANERLAEHCNSIDKEAIYSRVKEYTFTRRITAPSSAGRDIAAQPSILTPADFFSWTIQLFGGACRFKSHFNVKTNEH